MIGGLLSIALGRFEKRYDYDATYLRDVIAADSGNGLLLMLATQYLGKDFGLAPEVFFAAKVRSTMRADCGPCLRLALRMAEESGADRHVMAAALGQGMATPDAALAILFADAVLDNAPELTELSHTVVQRFGRKGRAGLATAVVSGQFYPLIKRGLGHAGLCEPVRRDFLAKLGEGAGAA